MSLEDELFDLLNSPDPVLTVKSVGGGGGTMASNFAITTASYEDSTDFLSWLDDSPGKKPPGIPLEHSSSVMSSDGGSSLNLLDQSDPVQTTSPSNPTLVSDRKESMDQFLDDVFGPDSPQKDTGVQSALIPADAVLESIQTIIFSPFPDIGKLREVIHSAGSIPSSVRPQVLLLLLTGSCHVDEEATRFHVSDTEIDFYSDILIDIDSQIPSTNPNPHLKHDILDILTLYCQRRSVSYKRFYTQILLSLYGTEYYTPKSQISSLFYSIMTTFSPCINLQETALEHATHFLHSILRLLLLYHSPRLTQHLDRVLPHWEQPYHLHTEQAKHKFKKASFALDSLEKELGIDLGFDFDLENETASDTKNETVENTPKVIESAPPSNLTNGGGIIPSLWLINPLGCIPISEESFYLLDWSIFNIQKYTGLYLLLTLLCYHEETLLSMNGTAITAWITSILGEKIHDKMQIFTLFQTSFDTTEKSENSTKNSQNVSSKTYISAWLHAMVNILQNTPEGVLHVIETQTENWAKEVEHYQLQQALLQQVENNDEDDDENEGNMEDIFGEKVEKKRANFEGKFEEKLEENSEKMSDTTTESRSQAPPTSARRASSILEKISSQILLSKTRINGVSSHISDTENDQQFSSVIRQQYPFHCQVVMSSSSAGGMLFLSLWSEAREVLSCLCASHTTRHNQNNNNNETDAKDVKKVFYNIIQNSSVEQPKIMFLHPAVKSETASAQSVSYFAIDCRSSVQKQLGLFPKAFLLDPDMITDGDGLDHLMLVLEPLVSMNTHIVIIGAGEGYHHFHNATVASIIEDQTRINAIAVYLQTKNFKYISILHGGYHALVQALIKHDSKYSLSSSLVDIEDRPKLHLMLGLPPPSSAGSSASAGGSKVTMVSRLESVVNDAPIAIKNVSSMISSFVQQQQQPAAAPSTANGQAQGQGQQAQQMFAGWGKAFGSSLETIKKNWVATTTSTTASTTSTQQSQPTAAAGSSTVGKAAVLTASASASSFTIDNDDDDDDGLGPRESSLLADSTGVSITRTDLERAQALAMHRMAGLKKGDSITISRSELPGAILFPCTKIKLVPATAIVTATSTATAAAAEVKEQDSGSDKPLLQIESGAEQPAAATTPEAPAMKEIAVSRYLVVSRERFIVLDAKGGGVGSVATVKSNHHLTELIKMTFKKKDPELVSIFIVGSDGENKTRQYRVSKYREFVTTLQKNMERFKV